MKNLEHEILDIGGSIDSLVDAFALAGTIEDSTESKTNLIDIDIDQALA